jgi:hypothetical protein
MFCANCSLVPKLYPNWFRLHQRLSSPEHGQRPTLHYLSDWRSYIPACPLLFCCNALAARDSLRSRTKSSKSLMLAMGSVIASPFTGRYSGFQPAWPLIQRTMSTIFLISQLDFWAFPPKIPPNFRRRFGQILRKACLLIPNTDFSKIEITSEPRTFTIEHVLEVASPIRTRCNVQPLLYSAESPSWFSGISLQ